MITSSKSNSEQIMKCGSKDHMREMYKLASLEGPQPRLYFSVHMSCELVGAMQASIIFYASEVDLLSFLF